MKKYLLLTILTILPHIAFAQMGTDGIGFSSWIREPLDGFSSQNTKSISVKIDQIIARNSAGSTSALSVIFAIYPEFIITREDVVKTGMKAIHTMDAELTLFAINKADMSNYGSVVITLKGNGNSKNQCIQSMLNTIRPTNPSLARFVHSAKDKISKYYTENMPGIMAKVNSLVTREQYDDALVVLSLIPESVAGYDMVAQKMSDIYMKSADREAMDYISAAKALIIQKKYVEALEELLYVEPLCPKFKESEILVKQIEDKVNQEERQELEKALKIYNDKKEASDRAYTDSINLAKMRIEASKEIAIEQAKSQAKVAEKVSPSGLSDWFLGKLK